MSPADARLLQPLRLEYLTAADLMDRPREDLDTALGGFSFSHPARALDREGLPVLAVDMALPSVDEAVCEIWHSHEALVSGQQGAIRYRQGDTLLFGCISQAEPTETETQPGRTPLQITSESAYQAIFRLLDDLGYPSILRVWNYFSAINETSHQIERYRQFNIGRQEAFVAHDRPLISNVPAACALGSASGGVQIAFLATRAEVTGIENPRQVSAYHYPSQYGPRSPTFARAGMVTLGGRNVLFISGTASIVGHQSLHVGDVAAQTRECLQNIAAVVDEANRVSGQSPFRLDALAFKVYVRRLEHAAEVRQVMTEFIGVTVSVVCLQADICRADLLVEIEASGGHATSPPRPDFET